MALDVNKIIEESLKEANAPITESLQGGMEAAKRSGKAAVDIFRGGSSQDEAQVGADTFAQAAKKIGEGEPESIVAAHYLKKASAAAGETGIGSKIASIVKENPGISAAAAAALAAGVGALALRRKLKKMKDAK